MHEIFKSLVDSVQPTISEDLLSNSSESLINLYRHYEISETNTYSLNKVQDFLSTEIQRILSIQAGENFLHKFQLLTIQDHLALEYLINGENFIHHLKILDSITNNIQTTVDFSFIEKWKKAIELAWDYSILSQRNFDEKPNIHKKLHLIAKVAKHLKSTGYHPQIKNGAIHLEESDQRKIANCIEKNIQVLGGISSLDRLLERMQLHYNAEISRYSLQPVNNHREIDVPVAFGYLFNLCVKNLEKKSNFCISWRNQKNIFQEILYHSSILALINNIHIFDRFDFSIQISESIVDFSQKLALSDSIFNVPQSNPKNIKFIIENLFSWLSEEEYNVLGWTLEEATTLITEIFRRSENRTGLTFFRKEDILNSVNGIRESAINSLLALYSHDSNSINSDFLIPQDISKVKFDQYFHHKPLVKMESGDYLLVDSVICAPAFYESIIAKLRKTEISNKVKDRLNQKPEEIIGKKVECLIQSALKNRGIETKSGKYGQSAKQKEIDILVESSDTILLFEVKKKGLTRRARHGDISSLLSDLSGALLESQIQLAIHEAYLCEHKSIVFEDDSSCNLENKKIARISVSLLDFGSFHKRQFLSDFLKFALSEENNNQHFLKSAIERLEQLRPQADRIHFDNCWFISVPQLFFILENVQSADDLKRSIFINRNISTNTPDLYEELFFIRRLKS